MVRRQKAELRDEQQTRVQILRSVGLNERVPARVESLPAHLGVDRVAYPLPARERRLEPVALRILDDAIERNPSHDLRMREMPLRPANFPDTVVRQLPVGLERLDQRHLQLPGLRLGVKSADARQ